jgi:hypothetical protein
MGTNPDTHEESDEGSTPSTPQPPGDVKVESSAAADKAVSAESSPARSRASLPPSSQSHDEYPVTRGHNCSCREAHGCLTVHAQAPESGKGRNAWVDRNLGDPKPTPYAGRRWRRARRASQASVGSKPQRRRPRWSWRRRQSVAEAKADASQACWRHCATARQLPHRPRLPERSPRRLAAAAAAATAAKAQAVGAFWSA